MQTHTHIHKHNTQAHTNILMQTKYVQSEKDIFQRKENKLILQYLKPDAANIIPCITIIYSVYSIMQKHLRCKKGAAK